MIRAALLSLALLLPGCATIKGGPQKLAETTCYFGFLTAIPIAGAIAGPAICSFGVNELEEPEEEDDLDV